MAPAFTDWYIREAWDINNSDQIVASAVSLTNPSIDHAVRLDPIGAAPPCTQKCLRVASIGLTARNTGTVSGAVRAGYTFDPAHSKLLTKSITA